MSDFARLLRHYRVRVGLSQEILAERAGISADAVGALERGFRKAPYRDTVTRLARALDLTHDEHQALEGSVRRSRGTEASHEDRRVVIAEHNLPRPATSFLGREHVVAEISALIDQHQIVTIVGTGGSGKTRTAIRVGTEALSRFADGVWLVELASLNDSAHIAAAVATELGVQESSNRPILDSIVGYLRHKRALLILDNCEHLGDQPAIAAKRVVAACPGAHVLATSREPLNVAGEHVYRLPVLSFPDSDAQVSEARAGSYEAVSLFVERARAANGRFDLGPANVSSVAEICRRVDGLPLAIELAAARIRTMTPSELLRRLDERFSVLTGGDRLAQPRQQTMRALIDWSYDLLSEPERLLLDRLSVFPSGFSLDAAVATCSSQELHARAVAELLLALVDKSLVVADPGETATRYRLLDSTRDYAAEHLARRRETGKLRRQHALAYLAIAEALEERWYTDPDREWSAMSEPELDNFRVALEWSKAANGGAATFLRLVAALARVWYALQPVQGARWIAAAVERIDDSTEVSLAARLEIAIAETREARAQFKAAFAAADRAVTLFIEIGDDLRCARAKNLRGGALVGLGRVVEGEQSLGEALSEARTLDCPRLVAMALGALGGARNRQGDTEGATEFYAEALAYHRRHGFERQAASIAGNLAEVAFAAGNVETALRHAHAALETHIALRNRRAVAIDLFNMSAYLVALDRFEEAHAAALQAIDAAQELQAQIFLIWALQHVAAVFALRDTDGPQRANERRRAAGVIGYVDSQLDALSAVREYTERQEYERLIQALLGELGAAEFERLRDAGSRWSDVRAVAEATAP